MGMRSDVVSVLNCYVGGSSHFVSLSLLSLLFIAFHFGLGHISAFIIETFALV